MKRLLVIACSLLLVASAAAFAQAQTLRVGSDVAYPPFEFIDETTLEPAGFDIDLIRAIGEVMGREVEIINTAWDGILPGLINGHYDVVISAMTITDERAAAVDFSDPYFATGQMIVVRADDNSITQPADLAGKRVAVQIGTTGHFAAESIQGADVRTFDTMPAAFLALKAGQADAAVADELVAKEEAAANPGQLKTVGRPFTIEYYGIAIRKGRTDLLREINRALATLKANGTYDQIYEKWFGAN